MSDIADVSNLSLFGEKVVCPWTSVSVVFVWKVGGVIADAVVRKVDAVVRKVDAVVLSWTGSAV